MRITTTSGGGFGAAAVPRCGQVVVWVPATTRHVLVPGRPPVAGAAAFVTSNGAGGGHACQAAAPREEE